MRNIKAELILFLIATIWAGTFIVIKLTIAETPPFTFVALRFGIAALLFYFIFFRHIKIKSAKEIKAALILGFLLYAGFSSQTIGLKFTTASNSALITGISVLLVPFAQIPILKKNVPLEGWISVFAAFAGLVMLTKPYESGLNTGDLITLICAVAWAFYIVYLDLWSRIYNIHVLVFIQMVLVVILCIIPAFIFEDIDSIKLNSLFITAVLYTSILGTLFATYMGNKYQKETTPVKAALIFLWEQPAAVMLSMIFLKEKMDAFQLLGGLLMIAGILYSETYEYINRKIKLR